MSGKQRVQALATQIAFCVNRTFGPRAFLPTSLAQFIDGPGCDGRLRASLGHHDFGTCQSRCDWNDSATKHSPGMLKSRNMRGASMPISIMTHGILVPR